MKENYRINEEKLGVGKSIVFLVKRNSDISKISFKDVEKDILTIFQRVKQSEG